MLGPAGSEHHIFTTPSGNEIFGVNQVPPAPPTLGWLILELDMLRLLLPPKVLTFGIPTSMERVHAFRSEEEWQTAVKAQNIDITFHNLDLLTVSHNDFRKYMNTWMIMLDEPYTVPFEREWIRRLVDANHLNPEMEKWWTELKDNAVRDGYTVYAVTKVGHASGTGFLDFSGGLVKLLITFDS